MAIDRDRHCAVHRMQAAALKGSTAARGYDAAWQELRAAVLREEPFCRFCLAAGRHTASEHVDHIRPISVGGTNNRINLRALCASCHNSRTRRDQLPPRR